MSHALITRVRAILKSSTKHLHCWFQSLWFYPNYLDLKNQNICWDGCPYNQPVCEKLLGFAHPKCVGAQLQSINKLSFWKRLVRGQLPCCWPCLWGKYEQFHSAIATESLVIWRIRAEHTWYTSEFWQTLSYKEFQFCQVEEPVFLSHVGVSPLFLLS